jgi:SAM-dependent methyltransferase
VSTASVTRLHQKLVFPRRVDRLVAHLLSVFPDSGSVLDIGAGDGQIARRLMDLRPGLEIRGVDVLVRPSTRIPVEEFDGARLPVGDKSVDFTMLIDVLHHTDDPVALMLEAARASRQGVIIKDHVAGGSVDRATLRLMDWVGNAGHGVRLPYNYLSRTQWDSAVRAAGLTEERWISTLHLYPFPASMLFDRTLHFIARLAIRAPLAQ